MNLSEKDKKDWIDAMKNLELWDENDDIEEVVRGDYWTLWTSTRGRYFFTRNKVIFISGWGATTFTAPYTDISAIKKSIVMPFLPFGITLTVKDSKNGKDKKYKMSVNGRNKWIAFLEQKTGVTLS